MRVQLTSYLYVEIAYLVIESVLNHQPSREENPGHPQSIVLQAKFRCVEYF
jgi:hypothetical protein